MEFSLQQLGETTWRTFQALNQRVAPGASIAPGWAPGALPKSYEKTRPPLGYPRETDSLCPRCVVDTRKSILSGERELSELVNGHLGEVRATLYERGKEVWITKTCPDHGTFDDLLSIDVDFNRVIEQRYPGRDFRATGDSHIHRHGTSSVRYGRGAVLTVDLTNRCNMMCNPCFMDANQVGYVHELTLDEVKKILDDSISFKPRRQMVVQFSGGEPTMSPHFLEALAYAKKVGYTLVQAATNGIRFALEPGVRVPGPGSRPRHGLPPVRRHHQRGQLPPPHQQPVRRPGDRDRPAGRGRRAHHAGGDGGERRQQPHGRPHLRLLHEEPHQDGRPRVPARVLHRARRGGDGRGAPAPALHHLAPRPRPGPLLRGAHRPPP